MAFTYRLAEGYEYALGGDEYFPSQYIFLPLTMPEDMEVTDVFANMEYTKWPVLLYFPKVPADENGENYNIRESGGDDYKYGTPVGLNCSNSKLSAVEVEETLVFYLQYNITTIWKWADGELDSREQYPVIIPGTIVVYNSTCREYVTVDVESPLRGLREGTPTLSLDEETILKYAPWSEKTPEPTNNDDANNDDNSRKGEQFKEIIRNKMNDFGKE